jgi:hypothetical protein
MDVDSELKELMIILPDGREIEAEVALRDEELDLAFLRPKEKPATPMAFIDLKQEGTPQVLDEVLVINRLNKTAKRVSAASIGRIEAIVEKPRPFYVLGQTTWAFALGAPVFSFDGKLAGFVLLRNDKSPGDPTSGFLHSDLSRLGMMPVVRPPADIVDGAQQALTAKPAEPAPKPEQ